MTVVTATLLSSGAKFDKPYEVLSIETDKTVGRIPTATVELRDGDVAKGEFTISDASFFEPGKKIEIKLRYEGEAESTVFAGVVVRHGIRASEEGSKLVVELKDEAVKLTRVRKSVVYRDQTDSDVIQKILGDAGVTAGTIDSTQGQHAELVQYHATDWDFILARADVQGLIVSADDGTVSATKMEVSGSGQRLRYGMDQVYELELEIDGLSQHSGVESVAWDIGDQAPTSAEQADETSLSQGNLDGGRIADDLGLPTLTLSQLAPMESSELKSWADARLARSRLAMIRGTVTVRGQADVAPLDVVDLDRMGQRFNGSALVTGVKHTYDSSQSWRTQLTVGLDPQWFSREEEVTDLPAAGLLPAVTGLQLGVVDEFEDDPDEELRVKVIVPAIHESEGAVWARLAAPDAGNERGYYFRPEKDDEVVVGFFNDDPRQAVILGSLFSSTNAQPECVGDPDEDNLNKAIVTKKGTIIGFIDDDDPSVFIETPDENRILMSDDDECIELTDQHGNSITLNDDGIAIKSVKDLEISVDGKLKIKASSDIQITSDSKVEIDAPKTDVM